MPVVASTLIAACPAGMSPEPSPSPLRDLTAALARGDDAAWMQFHREHGPGMFRLLLAETRGDHDLASEALQQAYLRVARHVRPCDSAPMFAGWLRVVARTALSDCRRRRQSFWNLLRRPEAAPEENSGLEADASLTSALDAALARLAEADRMLLEQKYFSGLAVRTLASQLNLTPKAVESRLSRARAELRRHLLALLQTP